MDRLINGTCDHRNYGVRLIEANLTVICNGCQQVVDAFDALLNYAAAEGRLVSTHMAIEAARKRETDAKAREKARRPFARTVTGFVARRDADLKAEPVIGYDLHLECGHTAQCGPTRRPRKVTCGICQASATGRA